VGAISQNNGLTSKPIFDGKNYTENQYNTGHNSTLAIGGVSSPLDSFVVAESSVLRTNFCGEKPAHRQSAKRQAVK
jgi:hypothetical protein